MDVIHNFNIQITKINISIPSTNVKRFGPPKSLFLEQSLIKDTRNLVHCTRDVVVTFRHIPKNPEKKQLDIKRKKYIGVLASCNAHHLARFLVI